MKGQSKEIIELLILVVGIIVALLIYYFFFVRTQSSVSSLETEQHEFERVGDTVKDFFYTKVPGFDKTYGQLLSDMIIAEGKDVVDYGQRYGGINVTKVVYEYFDSYFPKKWRVTIPLGIETKDTLWIPNSQSDVRSSVSKISPMDGKELGCYRTVPDGMFGNPSRVSLDSKGNVWVANRGTRTIVKVGLLENGQCVDKNGDGKIETSQDLNKNGKIEDNEIFSFKQDECLLAEVFLGGSDYGSFGAGGIRALCTDNQDNVYAGFWTEKKLFHISERGDVLKEWDISQYVASSNGPYGCFVDRDGILWISLVLDQKMLRFDPATEKFTPIDIGYYVYGIAPCFHQDCLLINSWSNERLIKLNTTTLQPIFSLSKPELANGRGVIVDRYNNIYAISSANNLVVKYDENGTELARAYTCGTPTGVGKDIFEKIWVTCLTPETIGNAEIRRYSEDLKWEITSNFGTPHYVYNFFTSYESKATQFEKTIILGYEPKNVERIRTFIIKFPIPSYIGKMVDVKFEAW